MGSCRCRPHGDRLDDAAEWDDGMPSELLGTAGDGPSYNETAFSVGMRVQRMSRMRVPWPLICVITRRPGRRASRSRPLATPASAARPSRRARGSSCQPTLLPPRGPGNP